MIRILAASACAAALLAGCATSPKSSIRSDLQTLGLSERRAACIADEYARRLDDEGMRAVADFVAGLNASESAGNVLDVVLSVRNPSATATTLAVAAACTSLPRE